MDCWDGYIDSTEDCVECAIDVGVCIWFCGNGRIDTWEQCDRNDGSKQNWGDYGCTTGCKLNLIHNAECNPEYDWQVLLDLNQSYPVCLSWRVSNFSFKDDKWTRFCVDGDLSIECTARKTYCGDGVLWEWEDCDTCPDDCSPENPDNTDDSWNITNDDCNTCPCEYADFSTSLTKWDTVRAKLRDATLSVFYRYSNSVSVESFLNIGK